MSTPAYERLMRKLALEGRDYFEGISQEDLIGLSNEEQLCVLEELRSRASKGDGVSLEALSFALPENEFLEFVEQLLGSQKDLGLPHAQLLMAAYQFSRRGEFWNRLLAFLGNSGLDARRWILNKIEMGSITPEERTGLVDVLAELIPRETDQSVLLSEITLLLLGKGFVPKSPELIAYAKRLQNPNLRERRNIISELSANLH